jgi:hypothetical protein
MEFLMTKMQLTLECFYISESNKNHVHVDNLRSLKIMFQRTNYSIISWNGLLFKFYCYQQNQQNVLMHLTALPILLLN